MDNGLCGGVHGRLSSYRRALPQDVVVVLGHLRHVMSTSTDTQFSILRKRYWRRKGLQESRRHAHYYYIDVIDLFILW